MFVIHSLSWLTWIPVLGERPQLGQSLQYLPSTQQIQEEMLTVDPSGSTGSLLRFTVQADLDLMLCPLEAKAAFSRAG